MPKKLALVVSALAMAFLALASACQNAGSSTATGTTAVPVTLNIAAASSLTKALSEINAAYVKARPWVTLTPAYAGSGTLQQQIENGAPTDVFISAGTSQMDNLQKEGLLIDGSRRDLLNNQIVLIVPRGNPLGLRGFSDLTAAGVKKIAIGDPASVPAGTYAQDAFSRLGILDAIKSKLILGANATQVLEYVATGNVDAGVVYSTDALSEPNVFVVATGPGEVNAKIVYPAAVVKASKNQAAARDFLKYLSGETAQAIWVKYGFILVK